jgi:hypothetical protein
MESEHTKMWLAAHERLRQRLFAIALRELSACLSDTLLIFMGPFQQRE